MTLKLWQTGSPRLVDVCESLISARRNKLVLRESLPSLQICVLLVGNRGIPYVAVLRLFIIQCLAGDETTISPTLGYTDLPDYPEFSM